MKLLIKSVAVVGLLALVGAGTFYLRPLWVSDQVLRLRLWREGIKSESVQVEGYRVHYFEVGPSSGTPLVLVHGLGDRAEAWAPLLGKLGAAGFHVYALDLVGYGRSSQPADADYSIAFEEGVLAGFMRALGLAHADVAGWSMGGWVVLKLGLDHPELADRLVVFDAAGVYFAPSWEPSLFDPQNDAELERLFTMLTPKTVRLPEFVERDLLRKFARGWWVVDRGLGAMRSGRDLLDFRLGGLKQPTLIVWGREDALIPLAVGERMHAEITGSKLLVVDGCGHLAPTECEEPVLRGMAKFLKAGIRD
jgi:pimeloyl-ACP methyl ester carboxylesterase